jgi:hypothetical protein
MAAAASASTELRSCAVLEDVNPFLAEDSLATRRTELENYQKWVKGNPARLFAITNINAIDGGKIDDCCAIVGKDVCQIVMRDAVKEVVKGLKVNGKRGQWNNGCFGSQWFDMDAKGYGLDYIRCAFYNKKTYAGTWPEDKPYMIQITIEKAK